MRKLRHGILALLAPGTLFAQEDPVVVTASRLQQPALEVPASIDRVYADEIHEGRPQVNLSESMGRVPGIVVQNRQNYAQDLQIQSRGFGARSTFGVRGIRLIADGIPATMPDGQGQAATFALDSAERIEVLRGPYSVLYGNASGGVINVTTADGPPQPTVSGSLLAGSYGTKRADIMFGGQYGNFNGIADINRFETEGYRVHSAAQRDHFNTKMRLGGPDTSVTLIANSLRQYDTQDPGGLTRAQANQDPRQVAPGTEQFNTRKTILHDQAGLVLAHRLDSSSRMEASVYYGERWVDQYLNIPIATQNAVTHSGGVVSLDRGFGGAALRYFNDLSDWFRLSVGGEYDLMHDRRKGFINNNGVEGALKRNEDNEVWATGLYAQGELRLAEKWFVNAGVRYSRVAFRNKDYFIVPGTANGDDSGDRAYSATTPVAGVAYRLNANNSLYANLGKGFETPTFVELANQNGASGLNFGLEAARSRHLEVGAKSVMPGWARVNAALFGITTENEIVVDQNAGGRATFKNVGHTDRRGFELAAETITGGPFEARLAYTYLKAVYRESFDTRFLLPPAPVQTVQAGNMIPGVPKNVLYGEVRYRREPFFAQFEGLAKSRVAVNDTNSEFASGYAVLNLIGGLVQQEPAWRLTEYVRFDNLANRNYVGSVIVNEGNGRYYEPSPRRSMTVGVQAALKF
jgi:iron complex outermembrane receptor protein